MSLGQMDIMFIREDSKNLIYNVCLIYKKAQMIKNLSKITFHKVYKCRQGVEGI